jgi:hypothetical protein
MVIASPVPLEEMGSRTRNGGFSSKVGKCCGIIYICQPVLWAVAAKESGVLWPAAMAKKAPKTKIVEKRIDPQLE